MEQLLPTHPVSRSPTFRLAKLVSFEGAQSHARVCQRFTLRGGKARLLLDTTVQLHPVQGSPRPTFELSYDVRLGWWSRGVVGDILLQAYEKLYLQFLPPSLCHDTYATLPTTYHAHPPPTHASGTAKARGWVLCGSPPRAQRWSARSRCAGER